MEYNFRKIEKEWQQKWKETEIYKVSNSSPKPKCYVLDMFPYPSGAGLHVGHPLGYIASDIYARYKRLKGFNVLHPMGYDSFGLPAEQYALETGQHPAVTTEKNINTFRSQLDNIGFCFDWSREVRTSYPKYYKWTQWIFLQLFNSYFCNTEKKALPISKLINKYATKGSKHFTAEQWNAYSEKEQQDILMNRRLAYLAYGEVNWCEALGTVLANDEVINGVSERGGHPVVKKKMRQWYLRITDYAERLLQGLDTVDFSDAMKEMQKNWIGKSEGAEIKFPLIPAFSPWGEGEESAKIEGEESAKIEGEESAKIEGEESAKIEGEESAKIEGEQKRGAALVPKYAVGSILQFENAKRMRKEFTEAENILWQQLRANQLNAKFRRQHPIDSYIVDFICLQQKLIIEIDGGYQETEEQKKIDEERTQTLNEIGFEVIRFTNNEVIHQINSIIEKIENYLQQNRTAHVAQVSFSPGGEGRDEGVLVYTTRPDTIFGVDFMVLAPEYDLVKKIVSFEQQQSIDEYLTYVKSRSERERLAEVKSITGAFTGAYAINPFNGKEIPIWISEYVLAGYGTGAIMAVPCGDQRDFNFAKHFNIPITNIIGEHFNGEEANPTKDATLTNSGFLDGKVMKDAIGVALQKIEENEIGKRKVNYKMRDAGFSRQRYWGEPFPIIYKDGIAYPVDEKDLPVELPHVENYKPGPEGEGPLANIREWSLIPNPSPQVEKGTGTGTGSSAQAEKGTGTWSSVPKYSVSTPMQYELAKEMRKGFTEAEDKLWQLLRNSQTGVKFRRQHPVEAFIVDFVSLQNSLIIEVDGGYHETEEQKLYDENRTKILNEIGFKVIRFTNDEILQNVFSIRDKIKDLLISNKMEKEPASAPLSIYAEGPGVRETNTMPGYAGSSWYFLRYMDPHNNEVFADKKATDYWNQVDVYVGGTEHAVGHLLYSRMWTKVLFDLDLISFDEPFKKLVNQGMIQGSSRFVYRIQPINIFSNKEYNFFISHNLMRKCVDDNSKDQEESKKWLLDQIHQIDPEYFISTMSLAILSFKFDGFHVDVNIVDGVELNIDEFKKWKPGLENAQFIKENGKYICGTETEKMSKSKYNTIDPNDLIDKYGADTFRMYEMFLGPVEQSKPWDTKGIEGIHRFLRKLWRLFYDDVKGKVWNEEKANDSELKVLHKTIKKIEEDTERFSYNTAVSAFMVCVNELTDLKCNKKEILEPLLILLTPYAPHIAEELYQSIKNPSPPGERLGEGFILDATFPKFESKYLVESEKEYPVSINGKMRTTINISLDASQPEVEEIVLKNEVVKKWMEGKSHKKIIFVKNKMVNVVV